MNDKTTTTAIDGECANGHADHRFALGLLTGGMLGLGLGMLFAPRAVLDLRTRATASARTLADQASDEVRRVRTRLGNAVDDVTVRGQGLRDGLADAVVRTAEGVERVAINAKTGH